MNWIDVTKQKPNEYDEVLVVNNGEVFYCEYKNGNFCLEYFDATGGNVLLFTLVTHWIALDLIVLPV